MGKDATMSGLYFEEFKPGAAYQTGWREISAHDIQMYAELSGDRNPIHTDASYMADTRFGKPIAHGLLTVSVLSGMVEALGLHTTTIIAMLSMEKMTFHKPVFAGDKVQGRLSVTGQEPGNQSGKVYFQLEGVNQHQERVVDLSYCVKIKRKPT